MKKNQQGFSVIEVVVIVLIIAVICLVGFIAWKNISSEGQVVSRSESAAGTDTTKDNQKEVKKIDVSVHDVDITLQSESDLDKLPSYTPDSFKEYLSGMLKDNKTYSSNIDDCSAITRYLIKKISQVNVSGGVEVVDENGQGCAGGAPAIWVLNSDGNWDKETLNGTPCVSKNGGLVYEEFASECYTDSNASSFIKNPNGSIAVLAN